MLILSSPSGAGKTTISNELVTKESNLIKSISVTTRKPRPGEIDRKDYNFINKKEFFSLCNAGQMLEHAIVFNNHYGIPREPVESNLARGINVLFSIDWQGAASLTRVMKEKVVSIFILPPSIKELQFRLKKRNCKTPDDEIKNRLGQACSEMERCLYYDYVITNHSVDDSVQKIRQILHSEKMKVKRKMNLKNFLQNMSQEILDLN
ncbi:guanylate kinase [Candidatus Mesenet endosymbiont of Agriotes lineatus]|uniref:guanylate kinase n=1 Tax=Candidatus Mesenet endosymbiont of Agriotes lineatus TaxID=3077948 RepID=UPI0030D52E89